MADRGRRSGRAQLAPSGDLVARATARAKVFAARPPAAVAQIKHALRAPAIETIARTTEAEATRWLETWFTPQAQARLRAQVARLGGPA